MEGSDRTINLLKLKFAKLKWQRQDSNPYLYDLKN